MLFTTLASLLLPVAVSAQYSQYPSVAHTASINGFADPIYAQLPACAKPCVTESTGNTPCPYWDPGCLCVIGGFANPVAECIASACQGSDVVTATSLAYSVCSSAGVPTPYWYISDSIVAELTSAAAVQPSSTAPPTSTSAAASAQVTDTLAPSTSAPATTSTAESSSVASSPAAESQTSIADENSGSATDSGSATESGSPTGGESASASGEVSGSVTGESASSTELASTTSHTQETSAPASVATSGGPDSGSSNGSTPASRTDQVENSANRVAVFGGTVAIMAVALAAVF